MLDYFAAGLTGHPETGDIQADWPQPPLSLGPFPKQHPQLEKDMQPGCVSQAEPALGRSWALGIHLGSPTLREGPGVVTAALKASLADQKSQYLELKPLDTFLNKAYYVHSYELVHPSACLASVHMQNDEKSAFLRILAGCTMLCWSFYYTDSTTFHRLCKVIFPYLTEFASWEWLILCVMGLTSLPHHTGVWWIPVWGVLLFTAKVIS